MDHSITPLKTASFGVLLIAIWLIVLGIWHMFGLFYTFPNLWHDMTVTYATAAFIILCKMIPLIIGIVLVRQHRTVVRLLSGIAVLKNGEHNSWNNTRLLASLSIGLFGLIIAGRGLDSFSGDHYVLWLILEIDNPHAGQYIGAATLWERLPLFMPVYFPIVLGLIFVLGARRIGHLIGHQIDKSLENPSEEEKEKEGNIHETD